MDCVIPQLVVSSLGAIAEWGLDIEKGEIKVSQMMRPTSPASLPPATSRPTGKAQAHSTGVAEACIA